ncbi:MAG: hypothetical protein WAT39_07075 [Planctomycetota bacterium]
MTDEFYTDSTPVAQQVAHRDAAIQAQTRRAIDSALRFRRRPLAPIVLGASGPVVDAPVSPVVMYRGDLPDAITVKGTDIASAATTNIAAATGWFVHVTGTTTITALGTATAGTPRVVRFAGALTLTHNATSLILPGSTNIVTAANDVAVFISEGSGNWRLVGYSRLRASFIPAGTIGTVSLGGDIGDAGRSLLTLTPDVGDIIYYDGASWGILVAGSEGQVLTMVSGVPKWSTP